MLIADINRLLSINIYIYIYIYIQSTPDRSDSQGTGKRVRLIEMSELSEIQNIKQINSATCSVKGLPKCGIMQKSTT